MIIVENFGEVDGKPAHAWRLESTDGLSIRVTDYGARLTELHVPGSSGQTADIVLGFDDVESYVASPAYFGATVGRYGNRITKGQFRLLGTDYQVDCNEGTNHLHGGKNGWDSRIWSADIDEQNNSITFRTSSPDGEMGFPGACDVVSTYQLQDGQLRIILQAIPNMNTVINMVHHSYYNLAGHASGPVLDQLMQLPSEFYVPVDGQLMPTGEVLRVDGTPYDFREMRAIGARFDDLPPLGVDVFPGGSGYDHNWCLRGGTTELIEAAHLHDPASGRRMKLSSTEPGVQMYTGGYLHDQMIGKGAQPYCKYAGFTLETQKFPDSPRLLQFPTTTVMAGETYRHEMLLEFSSI